MNQYRIGYFLVALALISLSIDSYGMSHRQMGVTINLAGKLRMLSQKISKEVFLVAKDIDAAKNRDSLGKTMALFDKTLKGLISGDSDLKLVKVENKKILTQLKKVAKLWKNFRESVSTVLGGKISKAVLGKIARNNLTLLNNMDKAVKMFEKDARKTGGVPLNQGMAVTLNLSGKQRMLTQKMTKELLLVSLGIDADKNKINLKETTSLFNQTLRGLLDGNKELELVGTGNSKIREQLGTVEKLWNEFKPLIDETVANRSNNVPYETLTKASKLNLPLLKEMNIAVKMYEESFD